YFTPHTRAFLETMALSWPRRLITASGPPKPPRRTLKNELTSPSIFAFVTRWRTGDRVELNLEEGDIASCRKGQNLGRSPRHNPGARVSPACAQLSERRYFSLVFEPASPA